MSGPTRRGLFGWAGAASAVPLSAAAAPLPDADLVAACNEYLRIQRVFEAYHASLPGEMKVDDPGWAILDPIPTLVDQMVAWQAVTAEGHLARARCGAFEWMPSRVQKDDPAAATADRIEAAVLRDLIFLERGAPASPVVGGGDCVRRDCGADPDHELLAACAEFDALERAYVAAGLDQQPGSDQETDVEIRRDLIAEKQEPLVDRICALRAMTRKGEAARARSLALWDAELMKSGSGDTAARLTAAIVRDLLRWGA